jgi:hypothetical protein
VVYQKTAIAKSHRADSRSFRSLSSFGQLIRIMIDASACD